MVCINERSDGREFVIQVFGKYIPYVWTRDYEKDITLFSYYEDRGNIGREYFFIKYKGYDVKVILDGKEFVGPETRKWKLLQGIANRKCNCRFLKEQEQFELY